MTAGKRIQFVPSSALIMSNNFSDSSIFSENKSYLYAVENRLFSSCLWLLYFGEHIIFSIHIWENSMRFCAYERCRIYWSCERRLLGLSQLDCWTNRQKTPLQNGDHSGNDPQLVPDFLCHCFGMFLERFRRVPVFVGSREIRLI